MATQSQKVIQDIVNITYQIDSLKERKHALLHKLNHLTHSSTTSNYSTSDVRHPSNKGIIIPKYSNSHKHPFQKKNNHRREKSRGYITQPPTPR